MKIARGMTHDLEGVYEMHRVSAFDLDTLIERFRETYVTGSEDNFKISFVLAVESMFGKPVADKIEKVLP
jgi:hypothetical protein